MAEKLLYSKNILITGASQGLGYAVAQACIKNGANLVINLSRKIAPDNQIKTIQTDLSDDESITDAVLQIEQLSNKIDVLINNAACFGYKNCLQKYDVKVWKKVMDTNIGGPFLLTQQIIKLMPKNSSIINVSSGLGIKGLANWGAYSVSKFAFEGWSQVLMEELKNKIRVNILDPGGVATELRKQALPDNFVNLPAPAERTNLFIYLASDLSVGITGKRFIYSAWDREEKNKYQQII